jgi:hypothetical protein
MFNYFDQVNLKGGSADIFEKLINIQSNKFNER